MGVVSFLTLVAVLGLYVFLWYTFPHKKGIPESYTGTVFGGPYESCQQQICDDDRKCMCKKKAVIRKCCADRCKNLPTSAKTMCTGACSPIVNPCFPEVTNYGIDGRVNFTAFP
jgi:hypothetical protein